MHRGFVLIGCRQFEQLAGVGKALRQAADAADDLLQPGALAAQFLGARRIVPDLGIFQFAGDFLEAFTLGLVVKDTPEATATRAERSAICVWMGLVSIMAAGLAVKEREHSKGTFLPVRDQALSTCRSSSCRRSRPCHSLTPS